MGSLTVTFAGICSHFREVVPGVPHRVVLPDAAAFHFGLLRTQLFNAMPDPTAWYLQPHLAILQIPGAPSPSIPNVMRDGYFAAGAHLQVSNAETVGVTYDVHYDAEVQSLRDFVPDFVYSEDVVLHRRATCYFDVHDGVVLPMLGEGGATNVVITIATDGPPILMLTPFEPGAAATPVPLSTDQNLDDVEITIANMEFSVDGTPPTNDTPFDFLLHYLSAQRGIPQELQAPTPGMTSDTFAFPLTTAALADALNSLAAVIVNSGPTAEQVRNAVTDLLNPSCSDSRYP